MAGNYMRLSLHVTGYPALVVLAALWLPIAVAPLPVHADIYKYVDENGLVHLSDRRLTPQYKVILRTAKRLSTSVAAYRRNRRKWSPMIDDVARKYRLDSALVHAVVTTESGYDAQAISKKGAIGLMQLMPGTARRYGVRDRRNPLQNVAGGVRYLRDLLLQFRSVSLALAAYNAGENAVLRYGHKIPPFPETRRYVYKVLTQYKKLKKST